MEILENLTINDTRWVNESRLPVGRNEGNGNMKNFRENPKYN